jgi:hypothetical protein
MEDQSDLARGDVLIHDGRLGRLSEQVATRALEVGPNIDRNLGGWKTESPPIGQGPWRHESRLFDGGGRGAPTREHDESDDPDANQEHQTCNPDQRA